MVFLFILLIIILMFLTIRLKIEFKNLKFTSTLKEHINKDYKIKITIYTFQKLPILKIKINNDKILNNKRINKMIIKEKDIDKEVIETIKKLRMELNEMDLKISIGTENAAMTALIIPVISTVISIFLSKKVKKHNNRQVFSIIPVYINENLINIEFSGIFQIKMIHIINTVCIANKKKRKGEKNERTSNRRAYDYSYEQH